MQTTLLTVGLICIVAAIVGGGVELLGGKMPVLNSIPRQIMLALLGAVLLFWCKTVDDKGSGPSTEATSTDSGNLTAVPDDDTPEGGDGNASDGSTASNNTGQDDLSPPSQHVDTAPLLEEKKRYLAEIAGLRQTIMDGEATAETQRQQLSKSAGLIELQQGRLDRGEGSPSDREAAVQAINDLKAARANVGEALSKWEAQKALALQRIRQIEQKDDDINSQIAAASQ